MDSNAMIPYFAHEGEMARMERINKKLWILVLVLVLALICTNAGWVYYESQFQTETVRTEIQARQEGDMNFVSGGDLTYGTNSQDRSDGDPESAEVLR